ncbi:SIS domain-containing protein [Xanthomonas sp. NCPPB 2654]|uniref:SIS domain-containing protein n=1 Tax=unclassified Xanthomonas TaxID=2643310 RepID=UPI0021E03D87|nr:MULTISPECIES: SIS domain-containing protein [unclassified Xanthomonas]MDL5365197.1 SIS domain-containing protein [Xanthomonas sp. NCPPB 2654]UYC21615.1 SIS domain-containing protein [Xanthomonas sp. CFBP 8443]
MTPPDALGIAESELDASGALWTAREIAQQPRMLERTHALVAELHAQLQAFAAPIADDPRARVILTGAGTSAYIGQCLAPLLDRVLAARVDAVPTTDIVCAPQLYLDPAQPLLLISFGRSGNSPESLAAVDLAEALVADVRHLVVTCNRDGALARVPVAKAMTLLLPQETHDVSFAMTSSFSCMMYATLAALLPAGALDARIGPIGRAVDAVLLHARPLLETLSRGGFERVVYLGSGLLQGLAREATLKLGELTNGAVATCYDSPLGFRHGPKTFVNARTLVVVFVSNDPYTRRYDHDLLDELRRDGCAARVVEITAQPRPGLDADTLAVVGMHAAADVDLLWPYIAAAQLFAFLTSRAMGVTPDNPNPSGVVNRVVQGVRLYALDA